ncbi:MAG TPA: 3-phosphoshikimate 1-carboxyvinyltransferase [Aggregatilineales bacterium]|nr:3-phosphoshikimate 1-carboxyvinyltransferase [Aggregatilineales bacterium]
MSESIAPRQQAIQPVSHPVDAEIRVPGSKSITNRALLLTALADGTSTLENALFSEDSHWFIDCLRRMGIDVEADEASAVITVHGRGGEFPAKTADCFVGNSGTTARFMTAAATLGHGDYRFDGIARMRERPIGNLLAALRGLGATITAEGDRFPLTVHAAGLPGGTTKIDASDSSQFLSALLQVAPYADRDVTIEAVGAVVSRPYIDITLAMMAQFGIVVDNFTYRKYSIAAGRRYRSQRYAIEPDASNATYFFAAAALTGGRVRVPHLSEHSLQGDAHFVDVLEAMGCAVTRATDYVEVRGPGRLTGIDIDLNAMSDTAQTLAAIAPFADSPVTIRGIEHIRHKETERIRAIVTELTRLGVRVDEFADGVTIYPSPITPGAVDTYNDHRMAMAFAVIGLVAPGIVINDPACTAKTFPDYFTRFEALYR